MNTEERIRKDIHDAIDDSLSHLDARPSLYGAIMAKTEGERPVKRKVSLGLVFALVLLLMMTAIGAAATRYGVLDFRWWQKENEEFVAHILTLDETYENEYVSIAVNDVVFDGVMLTMAMEMQPKPGSGDGVYVYPEMTATVNGEPLLVDIESCRGDFYSGIWSPEKDQGMIYSAGKYGADYVVLSSGNDRACAPQTEEVVWTLSLDILRPVYRVEQLEFGAGDEMEDEAYMKLFTDAYEKQTILLPFEGSPVEYVYAVGAPEGMDRLEWQRMPLSDKLVACGAFERVDRADFTFATKKAEVIEIAGKETYDLGEYEAELVDLSVTFGRMDYEIHVRKKDETQKTAGQEYADRELELDFAVLTQGCQSDPSMESSHPLGDNEINPDPTVRFAGSYTLGGELEAVTFVPVFAGDRQQRRDLIEAVREAGGPLTPGQEAMAITIKLK